MVDTARSITFLQSSIFQDGQPSGSITPQDVRDFVITSANRSGYTYGTYVRVTDPEFAADPTGATDSTAAFQNAMAKGPTIVPAFQPNGTRAIFRVQNCIVPSGATLIGEVAGPPYGGGGGSYKGHGALFGGDNVVPALIAPLNSTTTRLFNVDNTGGITFRSLCLDGSVVSGFTDTLAGRVCDGISAGGQNINVDSCSFYHLKNGIGGQVSGSTQRFPSAWWIANIRNSIFLNCATGISDMVDGHITDCWLTGCYNGFNMPSTSASTFVNCRFEWCGLTTASLGYPWVGQAGGCGATMTGALSCQFIGCYFDVNGNAGLDLTNAYEVMVNGCYFQCNGSNVTSGTTLIANSCHIIFSNTYLCYVNGCHSRADATPGTGVYAPAAWIHWGTACGGIVLSNNDMSGYQGNTTGGTKSSPQNSATLWRTGADPSTAWVGTASIAAATMTVTATASGALAIGQTVAGVQVIPGTRITAGSGTTWTVTPSQTVASTTMLAYVGNAGIGGGLVLKNNIGTGGAGCDIDSR